MDPHVRSLNLYRFIFLPLDISSHWSMIFLCCSAANDVRKRNEAVMNTIPKANREPAAPHAAEKKGFEDNFSTLFTTGIDRIADVQKRTIDVAVAQNAELTESWKKILQRLPGAPGLFLLDLAKTAFETYADTSKTVIDTMVEQGHAFTELTKDNLASASKASESM